MPYAPEPTAAPVYAAARRFVQVALRTDGSLLDGTSPVWSPPVLADLWDRFVGQFDLPGDSFDARWRGQLAGAPDRTLQLAGELLAVHVMFATDLSPATKRHLVHGTLGRAARPPAVPADLDAALETGIARTGVAFKARRQSQLRLLLEAVRDWKQLEPGRQAEALDDPAAFKRWLVALPHDGAYAQRELLLHLVHPEAFEPIASPTVKARIVAAFAEHVPAGVDDHDSALCAIRAALTPAHGDGFWFTAPSLAARWR